MTTCYFLIDGKLIVVSSWKAKDEIEHTVRVWTEDYIGNGDYFGRSLPNYIVDTINDSFVDGGGMTAMIVGYITKNELINEDDYLDGDKENGTNTVELYKEFVKQWGKDHSTPEFYGMQPPCYLEWYENEYKESEVK